MGRPASPTVGLEGESGAEGEGDAEGNGGVDGQDGGAVTIEGAITICSLVVVVGLLIGMIAIALDHVRCTDAAGEAARLLGRGDDTRAHEAVRRLAPEGASLTVDEDGDGIAVTVRSPILGGLLSVADVSAEAYAVREPDAGTR